MQARGWGKTTPAWVVLLAEEESQLQVTRTIIWSNLNFTWSNNNPRKLGHVEQGNYISTIKIDPDNIMDITKHLYRSLCLLR